MGAGKRELGCVVVEGGRRPRRGGVADLAGRGEPGGDVVWVDGRLVNLQVTRRALCGDVGELVVHVALRALRVGVGAGERESRGGVIESGTEPVAGGVAQGTIRGNARRSVIGVGGGRVFLGMAPVTGCRRAREAVAGVATGAIQRGMHADQGESREPCMVELHVQPVVGGVTLLAHYRELGRRMVDGPGVGVIVDMARCAGRGKSGVLGDAGALVAELAIHRGMRAEQRETRGVLAHGLGFHGPALDGMAVFAAGTQLAPVKVGVAIGAARGSLPEDHVGMALAAFHFGVHALERVSGLPVVVELRHGAQGLPADGSVAVAAGDIQRPMRAAHRSALHVLLGQADERCGQQSHQEPPLNS